VNPPRGPTSTARRRLRQLRATTSRRWRSALALLRAAADPDRATFAHLVVTRRCNLACGYCNEYDHTSLPVDLDRLLDRVDELARLGTAVVALSGGEPLLQPGATAVIRRIRERGMMAGLITNGYPLTPRRIASLNAAGLDFMQISIDNVDPDAISAKSLSVLDRRLQWQRDGAEFDVTINTVLGSGVPRPQDALTIVERARGLGFSTTLGVIHDSDGQLRALNPAESAIGSAGLLRIAGAARRIGSAGLRRRDRATAGLGPHRTGPADRPAGSGLRRNVSTWRRSLASPLSTAPSVPAWTIDAVSTMDAKAGGHGTRIVWKPSASGAASSQMCHFMDYAETAWGVRLRKA
jgi:hypothetical protein